MNTEEVMVNEEVDVDKAGVETGIEGDFFGEVSDTEAGGAEMGNDHRIDAHEDSVEEDCGPKGVAPDPGMLTQSEVDDLNVDYVPFRSWCVLRVEDDATGEQHRSDGPEVSESGWAGGGPGQGGQYDRRKPFLLRLIDCDWRVMPNTKSCSSE